MTKNYLVALFIITFLNLQWQNIFAQNNLENVLNNIDPTIIEDANFYNNYDFINIEKYRKKPININSINANNINQFAFLNTIQKQAFLDYKKNNGDIIDINELQKIANWNNDCIQLFTKYITVKDAALHKIKNSQLFILQNTYSPNLPKAYFLPDSNKNKYLGFPVETFLKYHFTNAITSFSINAKQQAGEGLQKHIGIDFISANIQLKNIGLPHISKIIIGDYTVQMQQGLLEWQAFYINKSTEIINTKKEQEVLLPKNSLSEINFKRGIATSLSFGKLNFNIFASAMFLDANIDSNNKANSIIKTGYHRSKNEIEKKNTLTEYSYGGQIDYQISNLKILYSIAAYIYDKTIQSNEIINTSFRNPYTTTILNSIGYDYNIHSYNFFGETAITENGNIASINGILKPLNKTIDIVCLYRHYNINFKSPNGNSFRENTNLNNEDGFYIGANQQINNHHQIGIYADILSLPRLTYNTYSKTNIQEYFIKYQYTIKNKIEIECNLLYKNKWTTKPIIINDKQQWTNQETTQRIKLKLNYHNNNLKTTTQANISTYKTNQTNQQIGISILQDILLNNILTTPTSLNIRLQYFDIASTNLAIYTLEQDVLHDFNVQNLNGTGIRYYINAHYKIKTNTTASIKWSQTIYDNTDNISSSYNQIEGNKKGTLKLQILLNI